MGGHAGRGAGAARRTAPTSTRSTACSRRRRWCGRSKAAATRSTRQPITSRVARLLIAAGSPLEWTPPEGAPDPERTLEGLTELRRDAAKR